MTLFKHLLDMNHSFLNNNLSLVFNLEHYTNVSTKNNFIRFDYIYIHILNTVLSRNNKQKSTVNLCAIEKNFKNKLCVTIID